MNDKRWNGWTRKAYYYNVPGIPSCGEQNADFSYLGKDQACHSIQINKQIQRIYPPAFHNSSKNDPVNKVPTIIHFDSILVQTKQKQKKIIWDLCPNHVHIIRPCKECL